MAAYHALDGVPCHANRWLLTQVLRQEWGFGGHVVSDAGGVEGLHNKHRVAADLHEAAKLSLEAGVDAFLGLGTPFPEIIVELVRQERLAESTLDQAIAWILRLKFELGLFEDPYVDEDRAEAICNAPQHRALALETARKSIVLLKNDGNLLPLARDARTILVAGPNADNPWNQLGDYSGDAPVVTVLEGIRNKIGNTASALRPRLRYQGRRN